MKVHLITFAVIATILMGCGEKTYTADYLLTDRSKRIEILEDCKANKQSTENCTNANLAQAAINKKIGQTKQKINHIKYRILKFEQRQTMYSRSLLKNPERDAKKAKDLADSLAQAQAELDALMKQ